MVLRKSLRVVIVLLHRLKLWTLAPVEASFFRQSFDLEMLLQEIVIYRLLVLSLLVDKPNAIKAIHPAVVPDPKSPTDVLPP